MITIAFLLEYNIHLYFSSIFVVSFLIFKFLIYMEFLFCIETEVVTKCFSNCICSYLRIVGWIICSFLLWLLIPYLSYNNYIIYNLYSESLLFQCIYFKLLNWLNSYNKCILIWKLKRVKWWLGFLIVSENIYENIRF